MNRPPRIPAFRIGSAATMAREPASPDLVNVSVRVDDERAFRGIITAREKLIEKKIDRFVAHDQAGTRLTEETANCALDAFIAMKTGNPDRDKVKRHLELTAAMAIAALQAMEGGRS